MGAHVQFFVSENVVEPKLARQLITPMVKFPDIAVVEEKVAVPLPLPPLTADSDNEALPLAIAAGNVSTTCVVPEQLMPTYGTDVTKLVI